MRGRFFRTGPGLGEIPPPNTPLGQGGALNVPPAVNLPPVGNAQAATQTPGEFRQLGDNQSVWQAITFVGTIAPQQVQEYLYRKYFLIQNKSGAGTIFVGFGYVPTEKNGLVLPPGVGYEPYTYPVNEIYITSDVNGVEGLILFGT